MSLTRLDVSIRKTRPSAKISAINATSQPGNLAVTLACAVRESVSSQMATTLSHERILEELLADHEVFDLADAPAATTAILQRALRSANQSVYEFGHRLSAGGRTACTGVLLVLGGGAVSVARAGLGGAYLVRGKEVFPFFEPLPRTESERSLDHYLGANAFLTAEITSVPLESGDTIYVFDRDVEDVPGLAAIDSRKLHGSDLLDAAVSLSCRRGVPAVMACIEVGAESLFLPRIAADGVHRPGALTAALSDENPATLNG